MTKYDIIQKISGLSGMRQKDVAFVIDNFLKLVIKGVTDNEKVELRGFGTFSKSTKKERKLFSPIAGKEVNVPAESVINFKPSKATRSTPENKGA